MAPLHNCMCYALSNMYLHLKFRCVKIMFLVQLQIWRFFLKKSRTKQEEILMASKLLLICWTYLFPPILNVKLLAVCPHVTFGSGKINSRSGGICLLRSLPAQVCFLAEKLASLVPAGKHLQWRGCSVLAMLLQDMYTNINSHLNNVRVVESDVR